MMRKCDYYPNQLKAVLGNFRRRKHMHPGETPVKQEPRRLEGFNGGWRGTADSVEDMVSADEKQDHLYPNRLKAVLGKN
jgi:hypothetical protein